MGTFKELELGVEDLDSEQGEERLAGLLKGLNGVHTVRLGTAGAHILYNPLAVSAREICEMVRHSGFKVVTKQESGES